MPLYHVKHTTRYEYRSPVTDSANQIILRPQTSEFQEIKNHRISVSPNVPIDYFQDYLGNSVGVFTIIQPHSSLEISSELDVLTHPVVLPISPYSAQEEWKIVAEKKQEFPYLDFVKSENFECKSELLDLVHKIARPDLSVMETTTLLSSYIFENFTYKQGVTSIETQIDDIWKLKAGVCQDFAHLLLELLRLLDIPARYVSGYISPSDEDLRGVGATHAWVEVFIPDYGWLGNDPTNNCWVSDRHIRIASGRNFSDCTPVKGTYKGTSSHTLTVLVVITNEQNKHENAEPIAPTYVSEVVHEEVVGNLNSYQAFLEMQQQQQQQ
ncbi:MAG: transglutaminase family protein [Flavobacterium sp.]|uniref:transglutaminase family protein n=1 Tax=Flavobacterium sp. TaxID=239 RepID=UPI00121E0092|nr:transglutaminase family protein [Flavobacterium sp.]RZJ63285.1 MAG: transglutaminase family protein [Flavobacterium sp.]